MRKNEFLQMMRQDLETHQNKELLSDVLEWVEFTLQFFPESTEIDSKKTVEAAYKAIESFARTNRKQVITPKAATKIIIDYLEVKQPATRQVNLEDFL